jgi:hypothetical protein
MPATQAKDRSMAAKIEVPFELSRPHEYPKTGTRSVLEEDEKTQVPDNFWKMMAEREGFEPDSDPLSNQQLTDPEDNSVPSNPHKSP